MITTMTYAVPNVAVTAGVEQHAGTLVVAVLGWQVQRSETSLQIHIQFVYLINYNIDNKLHKKNRKDSIMQL